MVVSAFIAGTLIGHAAAPRARRGRSPCPGSAPWADREGALRQLAHLSSTIARYRFRDSWGGIFSLVLAACLLYAAPPARAEGTNPPGTEVVKPADAGPGPRDMGEPEIEAPPHHGEADLWHRLQDWAIGLLGGVHPHGQPADQDRHREAVVLTLFGQQTELFVEFPDLVVQEPSEFLVHLTRLADHRPVTEGEVQITLDPGDGSARTFRSPMPARPGLFRITVTPHSQGASRLRIELSGPQAVDSHDLGEHRVFPDLKSALAAATPDQADEDAVTLLKEQQWLSEFATAPTRTRLLRGSVAATGLLRPSADGEAHVTVPIDGHLRPAPGGFPYTGMAVEQGQVIAYLVPQLGGEADLAGLELAVTRAESVTELARQERERLDALWEQRSVPYRQVLEARSAAQIADAELAAARRRLAQVQRTAEGDAAGFPIRAPIAGSVAQVYVAPGSFVEEGDRLFHLVDPERIWLEARVAEADIGRIRQPTGGWFRAQGFSSAYEVSIEQGARLVAFSAIVEPESRTVPVVFEFSNPDPRLRSGMFVTARVYTGEERQGLAVPAGALINDAGADVVFVQLSGEHFERRVVRTGLRDGAYVAIEDGLLPGERVVSRGAYLVHLAAGAPAHVGHGHAH